MAEQGCLNTDFQDKSVFKSLTEYRKRLVAGDFLERRHHLLRRHIRISYATRRALTMAGP